MNEWDILKWNFINVNCILNCKLHTNTSIRILIKHTTRFYSNFTSVNFTFARSIIKLKAKRQTQFKGLGESKRGKCTWTN